MSDQDEETFIRRGFGEANEVIDRGKAESCPGSALPPAGATPLDAWISMLLLLPQCKEAPTVDSLLLLCDPSNFKRMTQDQAPDVTWKIWGAGV